MSTTIFSRKVESTRKEIVPQNGYTAEEVCCALNDGYAEYHMAPRCPTCVQMASGKRLCPSVSYWCGGDCEREQIRLKSIGTVMATVGGGSSATTGRVWMCNDTIADSKGSPLQPTKGKPSRRLQDDYSRVLEAMGLRKPDGKPPVEIGADGGFVIPPEIFPSNTTSIAEGTAK